jgi:hypothetical protein
MAGPSPAMTDNKDRHAGLDPASIENDKRSE